MASQYQKRMISSLNNVNTTVNSAAIDASNIIQVSAQAVSTGTPTGSFKLQASNDSPVGSQGVSGGTFSPSNWSDIPSTTTAITTAAVLLIPKTDICYQFIRVVFISTDSNAGGSTVINIKVLEA